MPLRAQDHCGQIATAAGLAGYCIHATDRRANPDVLYYFHGADGPAILRPELARPWRDDAPGLLDLWRMTGATPPTIISITWGPAWVLKEEKLAAFRDALIPGLEARLTDPPVRRRLLLGGSLGGLNALLAWAQMPEMFAAVALQCPALTRFTPFADRLQRLRERNRIMRAMGMDTPAGKRLADSTVQLLSIILKPLFATPDEWAHYQPDALMARTAAHARPPAYLVYNANDEFGLDRAAELTSSSPDIHYERLSGRHCVGVMTPGLAAFLADPARGSTVAASADARPAP